MRINAFELYPLPFPFVSGGYTTSYGTRTHLNNLLLMLHTDDGRSGLGGTQKLKKFFSNHKISIPQRKKCPLLLSADKIIWVAGHRIDHSVRLSPQTQRVLMAELLLA